MGKAGSGFKKPAAKKKTGKKDIIQVSLFIAAIVVLIAVFAFVVAGDDFIRTKNGRLQMEDNWLIAQFATKNGTAWYQVGEVADMEGFYLSSESIGSSVKYFYPDDVENNVAVIYVGAAVSGYEEMLASLSASTITGYGVVETVEPVNITIADRDAIMANCIIPAPVTEETVEETAEEATGETTEEAAEEVTEETTEETAEEATEETSEETADEAADEETDEVTGMLADDGMPGSIIYACIDYDDERCVFIQINTYETVTDEEAMELVEMVGGAITLKDR